MSVSLRDYLATHASEEDVKSALSKVKTEPRVEINPLDHERQVVYRHPDNARQIARYIHADAMLQAREYNSPLFDLEQQIAEALGPLAIEYLDPPDGGDVSLPEQVRRMREELIKTRGALVDTIAFLKLMPQPVHRTGVPQLTAEWAIWDQKRIRRTA